MNRIMLLGLLVCISRVALCGVMGVMAETVARRAGSSSLRGLCRLCGGREQLRLGRVARNAIAYQAVQLLEARNRLGGLEAVITIRLSLFQIAQLYQPVLQSRHRRARGSAAQDRVGIHRAAGHLAGIHNGRGAVQLRLRLIARHAVGAQAVLLLECLFPAGKREPFRFDSYPACLPPFGCSPG